MATAWNLKSTQTEQQKNDQCAIIDNKTVERLLKHRITVKRKAESSSTAPDDIKDDAQISLKLSTNLLNRCDKAAREASMTRSAYIKFALNKFLKSEGF